MTDNHLLLYRLAELMLQYEQHILPVDLLFDDEQIGDFVKSIQIDSPYQQMLLEGVLTESVRDEKLYLSFTVEGYFHYVLGEVINSKFDEKDAYRLKQLAESNSLNGIIEGIENCLNTDIQRGVSSRLIDLIDMGGNIIKACVTPMSNYLINDAKRSSDSNSTTIDQLEHVSTVMYKLFSNPTDSDIEIVEMTIEKLMITQKNEVCSFTYKIINNILDPSSIKKALLYVKSIEHIEEQLREKKLDYILTHAYSEDSEFYTMLIFEISTQYAHLGEFKKAFKYYEKSLLLSLDSNGIEHSVTGDAYNNMGQVLYYMGNYDKAIEYYDKSLMIRMKIHNNYHTSVAGTLNNLGAVWSDNGYYDKAIEYYDKSLQILLKIHGNQHPLTSVLYNNIGLLWSELGEEIKAFDHYEKSLNIRLKVFGDHHPSLGTIYNNIGSVLNDLGKYDESIEYSEKSLGINLKVFGDNHHSTGLSYNTLGNAYNNKGDKKIAKIYFKKAHTIFNNTYGEEHKYTKLLSSKVELINDH